MSRLAYTCSVNGGDEITASVDSSAKQGAPIDAADLMSVWDSARVHAGAAPSASVSCSRITRERPRQDEDAESISRRMTPDCAKYGWDPSHVVSYEKWSCRYMGQGVVDGKKVYNPFREWKGTIASCAPLNAEDMRIPDSTMDAIRRTAYWQADGDGAALDKDQFVCRVSSLPRL